MTTFQKVKIKDIAKINPDSIGHNYEYKKIEYVDISNVGSGNMTETQEMDIQDAPSRAKRLVKAGDTILSTVRPNRRSFFHFKSPKENTVVSTGFAVLRALGDNNPKYLYYSVIDQAFTKYLTNNAKGAAYPAVDADIIYDGEVFVPRRKEDQIRIASVLSAYDDLIENNEKRIRILEEMAQRLYNEWFVRFRFPGYEKVKMIDSGAQYGMIPEGWKVKKLGEVSSIVRGCSYSSDEIDDYVGNYYIVNLKNFNRGGGFRFDGAKYYSGSINNNQSLKTGDIVIAVTDMTNDRAVIARPARIPEIDAKITLSADVVKINSDIMPSSYVYELLSSYRFTETTKQKANGANVLHLKPTAILEYVALIPDAQPMGMYDVLCKPIAREIDKLLKQNDNLSRIRDLLIPQLVVGRRELK